MKHYKVTWYMPPAVCPDCKHYHIEGCCTKSAIITARSASEARKAVLAAYPGAGMVKAARL